MQPEAYRFLARSFLVALVACIATFSASTALAAYVTTIAGNGLAGISGDGGPATAAALDSPNDVAVAADGTVYIADGGNFRIRRISPGGTISTIAGNGDYGDYGDGGQATDAELGSIEAIALSPADDVLYISDGGTNRVRQVNLANGVITTFAGRGLDYIGHTGNGGPATSASIGFPRGIAVDPTGNVYFTETMYCTVRKVNIATQVITREAGSALAGDCTSDGDGGTALSAHLGSPSNLATDAAGNLFVVDTSADTVRRIDAVTHVITTIAGGGVTIPGFGAATTMDLGDINDIAIDDANNLFVSNHGRVFKVDLGTGNLSVYAGNGSTGFSGDGGPALDATFANIWGLDIRGNKLFIADTNNNRIRAIVPPPLPDDLVIESGTLQEILDSVNVVVGSILMVNVDGREYLLIPNATSVGLNVTLTGNDQLLAVDLGALQNAGGSITISGNLAMQSVDLSSLVTIDGSLTVTDNPALNIILISGVTGIGGDLTVVGTAATVIDLSALTTVTGSLDVSDNVAVTAIDMGGLATVTGSLDISDNTSATAIDMSGLTTVSGDLIINGNTSVASLDLSNLSAAGSVNMSDNTATSTIDVGGLATVTGSLDISDNTSATAIDMSGLTTVGGNLIIVGNGDAAVNMSAGTDVGGDLAIETTGTGSFSMGDGTVTGNATLDATGYTDMSGNTPVGNLDLTATRAEAVMHLRVQAATFTTPVSFSVTRVDPAAMVPENGLDDGGDPATIDPIAAYQFTFGAPTLDRDAELSFDIVLAALDTDTRTDLLDALAAGTATLVTKGDAIGGRFQAFPVCASAETPTAGGCVQVETLDAGGLPTTGTPARVRFGGVIGHFSTWAVATVAQPDDDGDGDGHGGGGSIGIELLLLALLAWARRNPA